MKKGDKLAVSIEGTPVGYAEIVAIGEETVELLIPAQKVVARKRVQVDLTPEVKAPEVETVVTGVDKIPSGDGDRVEAGTITAENVSEGVLSPENNEQAPAPTPEPEKAPEPVTEPPAVSSSDVGQSVEEVNDQQ